MKAVVLIQTNNHYEMNLQFNQVLAMLSYDIDLHVVFSGDGLQLIQEKRWKSLELYSENPIYFIKSIDSTEKLSQPKGESSNSSPPLTLKNLLEISKAQLKAMIQTADIVL